MAAQEIMANNDYRSEFWNLFIFAFIILTGVATAAPSKYKGSYEMIQNI